MARAPVRPVSAPAPIRPVASPVDAFVRPADPARSSLYDLADGLSSMDSGLNAFLGKRKQKQEEADYERGRAAAYQDFKQSPGLEEGVRRGLIPPQESPRFMEGLRAGQGNVAGMRLRSQFTREFLQWDGRNAGDPEGFSQFLQDFVRNNVPEDADPEFLKGLNPHVESLFAEGYEQFTKDTASAVYGQGLATDSAQLTETIRVYEEDGQTRPGGVDYDSIWTHALAIREDALRRGTLVADIDAYLVDTIILNAERTGDETLLALLDRQLPDAEHPVSFSLEVQKKRDAAATRIANANAAGAADAARAREKAEEQLAGRVYAEVATIWARDIREEIPEEVIEDLSRIDPMARSKLVDLRKKMAEADGIEDKATIARIFSEIHEGTTTKADILQHFQAGTIRSTETLNQALDRVDRMDAERRAGTGVLSDATLKKWHSLIEKLTGDDKVNPLGSSGPSDEGMEAIHDLNMMVLDWERQNPEATYIERQEAYNRLGNIIRGRIELGAGMTSGGQYLSEAERSARDAATMQPEPITPATPPIGQEPALEPEPEAGWLDALPNPLASGRDLLETLIGTEEEEAPTIAPELGDIPPLASLPDDQRQTIDSLARRHGLDPEEVNRDIWSRVRQMVTEPESPPSPAQTIPEDVRDRLTGLLSNPPRLPDDLQARIPTAPILDLIGQTEGTDRGDSYNETLGYGAYTGGDVNLVGMTLDEVDALQTQMLRHPDNSWNSSAAGRYQIVRKTLRNLRQELGLRGDERFDEAMQDRLAVHLLETRGLSRWRAGEISDTQFLNALAQEWASLPTAEGRGHYKGQRAATTPKKVLAALHAGPPGHSSATLRPQPQPPEGTPAAYAKIPDVDGGGRSGQVAKFIEWNSDPIGNHEANLASIEPSLADVVRRAGELAGVRFVVGSGRRDAALQAKAVEWGWSKTQDSDHLTGSAVDLWPIDEDGAVNFSASSQAQIVKAMRQAAQELGVPLDIGADWKRFKDKPHFALRGRAAGA